tara:strand:+ start:237 stop:461 length:225 start_codon:yes stop_codon:yes gene_type:complete
MKNAYGRIDEEDKEIPTGPGRKPLTSEQINRISQALWDDPSKNYTAHTVARAIEAAHGIEDTGDDRKTTTGVYK